ncbi:DUF943 family protein [Erwinia mallotivora]|uniref:Membrane protein n=1 Tax=Erwinia mallotivora TaxID=69222 RepID=A0A014PSF9_9GAMM|nr:DUF943 family protein [Erwinia mallotivora]EXU73792.1 membrane protein [Erwinia mallotivora]
MKFKKKKVTTMFLSLMCLLVAIAAWLSLRTVDIIAIHKDGSHSYVLVKKFPFTEKGRIKWWLKNKDILEDKYKIPSRDFDGSFVVTFWNFGEGYKETDGYDRLCFVDMPPPLNCIDKDAVLMVRNSKNTGLYFILDEGIYRVKEGKIVEIKSD